MKLFYAADPNSTHVEKWVDAFARKGYTLFLFGLPECLHRRYSQYNNVQVVSMNFDKNFAYASKEGTLKKLSYLKAVPFLRKKIKEFQPDIIHAHSAQSYGFLSVLSKHKPVIISVYGSDVLSFPNRSWLHKKLIAYTLKNADRVLVTSEALRKATEEYRGGEIPITPFGVDTEKFSGRETESLFTPDALVFGTIKGMEHLYGIDLLIEAFITLRQKYTDRKLKLLLVGGGTKSSEYQKRCESAGIADDVLFTGFIEKENVPRYHAMIDVFVVPSRIEGFGVAALEASASGKPVIASDAGGLPEIVSHGESGFIVPAGSSAPLIEAMEQLFLNPELRNNFGKNGRRIAVQKYEWNNCVALMDEQYRLTTQTAKEKSKL